MEPDDALTGDLQEAQAAGNQSTDWRAEEGQDCAVNSDGKIGAHVRPEVEHVPEAEDGGDDGHGKDDDALDGYRQGEHKAYGDESRQDQRQHKSGYEDSCKIGAKIRVGVHGVLLVCGRVLLVSGPRVLEVV